MTAYLKHKNEEDEEEKEMISLIPEIIALLGGIVSAVLIALPLNSYIDPLVGDALGSIVIAPLVEEPAKMIGIIILALYYPYSIIGKKEV
jgi:RsiW-degrading membrane proteinase PrsW (M82 family)